jgi:hypothetical protein
MITAEEFDKKFDNGEETDEYIDYENPLKLDDLIKNSVTVNLSEELKQKILQVSKKLNMSVEDTIKALLAKEVGVL